MLDCRAIHAAFLGFFRIFSCIATQVTGPATPLRVLLVEDREDDAAIVMLALEQGGYDVTWQRVETREAAAEALRAQTWDVIISDFHLPRFSAPAALALRRELGIETPFIIVSGTIAERKPWRP